MKIKTILSFKFDYVVSATKQEFERMIVLRIAERESEVADLKYKLAGTRDDCVLVQVTGRKVIGLPEGGTLEETQLSIIQ